MSYKLIAINYYNMHPSKRYIHDRLVLLLISASAFIAILTVLTVIWQLGSVRSEGYITQYRPSLGLSAFKKGTSLEIIAFPIFAGLVFLFHLHLSIETYRNRRYLAVAVLGLGLFLIVLWLISSVSLLRLPLLLLYSYILIHNVAA